MVSNNEIRESTLRFLYEKVEEEPQIPTLADSTELVNALTEEWENVSEDDILYIVERLDESRIVDFEKHSDGHGPIKIWPRTVKSYEEATGNTTFLSDGRLGVTLSILYQHDKETNGQPMSESGLADETELDEKSLNATIWYLYTSNFIDAVVDTAGWHNPSITESGRKYYERKWA